MIKLQKLINVLDLDYSNLDEICSSLEISRLTGRVLINRGNDNLEKCKNFIKTDINNFFDPYLLNDMEKAVDRIIGAIKKKESIWIFGDYDVDGVTSTATLIKFFNSIGVAVNFYIPNRHTEGYGLNRDAINYIYEREGQLIITVDCGISSFEEVEHCKNLGIEIIITDHHQCGEVLPNAYAIINPNRFDSKYPFNKLAGVGVTYKLIQALAKKLDVTLNYKDILPITAIGTIADVVSLTGENRVIVKNGLDLIKESNNIGLKSLIEVSGLDYNKISSGHIAYIIAPRINAAGRMGLANDAVKLLISSDKEEAVSIAIKLDDENKKRQEVENIILKEVEEIIEKEVDVKNEKVIVVAKEGWHSGVIGIVSSKITEKYNRPSIIITLEGDKGKGSARSILTFDIYEGLKECKDLLENFGGHRLAAGLTIKKDNIKTFRQRINEIADLVLTEEDLIPEITVDGIINSDDINIKLITELKDLEPFGIDNPSPLFLMRNATIKDMRQVGKDNKHLKLLLNNKDNEIECIAFNHGGDVDCLSKGKNVDIVFSPEINTFNGNEKIQLNIKYIMQLYNENNQIKNAYFNSLKNILLNNQSKLIYNYYVNELGNNGNRLGYLVETLNNNKNSLILVYSYSNLMEIITEIQTLGRKVLKNTSFCLNKDNLERLNTIVINPDYDNLLIDKYDEVIFYDLIPSYINLNKLVNNPQSEKIKIFFDLKDIYDYTEYIDMLMPSVEELRLIYKSFITYGLTFFKIDIQKFLENLCKVNNICITNPKLELLLEILKEANLIDYKIMDEFLFVKMLNKPDNKFNIEQLPKFRCLKNIRKKLIDNLNYSN